MALACRLARASALASRSPTCGTPALRRQFHSTRPAEMLLPGGLGEPPPGGHKIGFNTYAMWGLCIVVVGVCYVMEQRLDGDKKPLEDVPAEVARVLPSGAWLMKDGSIQKPAPPSS